MRQRFAGLAAVAVVVLMAMCGTASATSEHYCTGTIRYDAYCGGNFHNGIYYVEVITDHTACAGFAQITGYYYPPLGGFADKACTTGSGSAGTGFAATDTRGGVRNPNFSTYDNISDAHSSY